MHIFRFIIINKKVLVGAFKTSGNALTVASEPKTKKKGNINNLKMSVTNKINYQPKV